MTTQQNNTASLPTDAEIAARIEAEPVPERLVEDLNRVEFDAAYWQKQANTMRRQRDKAERERDELMDVLADMIENYRYEVDGSGCARSRCSDCGAFYREPHVGDCIIGKAVGVIGSVSRAAVDRAKATGAPHAAP